MALTITRDDVRRKCMIAAGDTTLDDAIDSLIAEMRPALEYSIEPGFLANPDEGLQALLTLGVLELISAELLSQRAREPGFAEEMQVGGIRIGQSWERGKLLFEQGAARLAPFRRAAGETQGESGLYSSTSGRPRRFGSGCEPGP